MSNNNRMSQLLREGQQGTIQGQEEEEEGKGGEIER